jgi:hypothetical protein
MRRLILAFGLVFMGGCASVPQSLDPAILYARALQLTINGADYQGVAVVPKAATYKIEIKSQGKMDLLLIKSCHREWYGEKVGSKGFFQKTNSYLYEYTPDPDLERRDCPLEISALDASSGAHAWAFVDFEDPGYALPATYQCNGETDHYGGVSVCQSRKGLTEEISFDVPVIVENTPGCQLGDGRFSDGRVFPFQAPDGRFCHVTFMEMAPARRKHRTTWIGYSDIVPQAQ